MRLLSRTLVLATGILPGMAAAAHLSPASETETEDTMVLGAFSISLAVEDLQASREFYEKLGFTELGGEEPNYLIMQNGTSTVGLFQGMFKGHILTFNPGWNHRAEPLEDFQDVRDIQRRLKDHGLELAIEADESTSGPASLVVMDPDGNTILIDQHVDKPD